LPNKSTNFGNFLILGTQRTGSQALYWGLNLHPNVVCGAEWTFNSPMFKKVRKAEQALAGDFHEFLVRPYLQERYANAVTHDTQWLGFKILFRSSSRWFGSPALAPALWVDRLEEHLSWLRRRPDIHVIQLIRLDPVEWLKSKYLSQSTGMYVDKEYPQDSNVRIPVRAALRAVAAKRWVDERIASVAATNPYHRVLYEDFLADNRKGLESCLAFLGCDSTRLPDEGPYHKRQSKGDAASYIENYEELVTALERAGAFPAKSQLAS
jgi:hypothetical protein